MGTTRKAFTPEERGRLLSLDAVDSVGDYYIAYSESFKAECMEAYRRGASPAQIFRSAGLDPKIIGRKRIERAVARWKADEKKGNFHRASAAHSVGLEEKRARLILEIRDLQTRTRSRLKELAQLEERINKRAAERRAS